MFRELKEKGITATLILDAAAGYIMEKVDMVLVGAEGIMASGGIINKVSFIIIMKMPCRKKVT